MLHQVGIGVLGPVFRTYEPERDRLVAVKAFRLDLTPEQSRDLAADLQQVAELNLSHPSLVSVVAGGVEGTMPYVAMDYVAAESLDVAVRHYAPAPLERVLPFVTQLAGAIDLAAAAKVRHGALHPRDIFVTPDVARVGGFGIAQAIERVGARCPVRRPYSPPERIDGGAWSTSADVFALAAIAFELLTGRRVTGTGEESAGMLDGVESRTRAALVELFATALAVDPRARYPTTLSFAGALASAAQGEPAPVESPKVTLKRVRRAKAAPEIPLLAHEAVQPEGPEARGADDARDALVERPATAQGDREQASAVEAVSSLFDEDKRAADVALGTQRLQAESGQPFQPETGAASLESGHGLSLPPESVEPPLPSVLPLPVADAAEAGVRGGSAMLPVAVGVMVGVLIGFVAGYGLGSREPELSDTTGDTAAILSVVIPDRAGPSEPPESQTDVAAAETSTAAMDRTEPSAANPAATREAAEPSAAREPSADGPGLPASPVGRLIVRSTPAGATVVIADSERGTTPLTLRGLPHGTYAVRVVQSGYEASEQSVTLTAGRPTGSLSFELQPIGSGPSSGDDGAGAMYVQSRPAGARVFMDGVDVGATPLLISSLQPGSYEIRLERAGYARWSSTVEVAVGARSRVAASLDTDR